MKFYEFWRLIFVRGDVLGKGGEGEGGGEGWWKEGGGEEFFVV